MKILVLICLALCAGVALAADPPEAEISNGQLRVKLYLPDAANGFYQGTRFPAAYRGHAFATLRGSSNRSVRTGYKVIRIPFANGKPSGGYEDFATGWMLGEDKKEVWGRPVGIAVAGDGSLLVVDDAHQKIYRVTHR